jgi:hypothetical protein
MGGTKPGENEFDKIGSQYILEKLDKLSDWGPVREH